MVEIHKILVPLDFSKNSLTALEAALDLAPRFDAEVVLIHVVEFPIYPALATGAGAASMPTLQTELRDNAVKQLEKLRRSQVPESVRSTALVREGTSPAAEIVNAALDQGVDLISIATHGHTGFKHLLLGSTTEKVVRKAHCPVLTVRCAEVPAEVPADVESA